MNAWIEVTGWTLIHFVWQGTLLALATAAVLRACRRPHVRYAVACAGLAGMLASVATTALVIDASAVPAAPAALIASPAGAPAIGAPTAGAAAAASADPTASNGLSIAMILRIIVGLWISGVVLLLARLAGGCWRVRRLRTSVSAARSPWQRAGERLACRVGVTVAFRVVESRLVATPIVIGWLRPLIVLPVAMLASMPAGQVEAVIAHELAHIRRRDYAVNLLQTIAEALLFFHPGVWWVSSRIRTEREHCCDDAAVAVVGEVTAYAEALAALASWRGRALPLVGAADGSLLRRIRRLLGVPQPDQTSSLGGLVLLGTAITIALIIHVVLPGAVATAQPPAAAAQSENLRIRQTDHFEIYYAPSLDLHADRVAADAERAYERVSAELRHNLAFKVPLVLAASGGELERSARDANGIAQAGPSRDRIALAVDRPADVWFGVIIHELTHVFQFDIIPGDATPAWISEGLAEFTRGTWEPGDLAVLRQAVRANAIPAITRFQSDPARHPRFADALGHAAFDFIESRWGKAGMRQFLLVLRQRATGGGDPYEAAFGMTAGEFDAAFERYLRGRFASAAPPPPRFDANTTRQIDGVIAATSQPAAAGLACLELLVPLDDRREERWGVECGDARAEDIIRGLRPGQRVLVTGAPATTAGLRRLTIRSLVRPADGFAWRLPG